MTFIKYIALLSAITLITCCFLPWVYIETIHTTVTGISTGDTSFGKPGYIHILLSALYIMCTLTPRVWAKRLNLLVAALNTGWAIRNFLLISACEAGDCPVKKMAFYFMLISSIFMMIAAFFPKMEIPGPAKK